MVSVCSIAEFARGTEISNQISALVRSLNPRPLKIQERIHFKVLSLTYNSLHSSQPTSLCEFSTTHPPPIILLSPLFRLLLTSHLMFSNQAISITALVFGMTYHLNSTPFLYLNHRHCRSDH